MKRIVIGAVIVIGLIGTANAQFKAGDASKYPDLTDPVGLDAPGDLPDVAQCRGILSQIVLDIVNGADEDPADTFEKNRRAHPHMIMMPPPLDCASKLWRALKKEPRLTNFATVPEGTRALSLRQYPVNA